jgi:hypothetical protein
MSTTPSTLELDRPRDGVVVVRLNRPERLNAINEVMQTELAYVLDDLATDQSVHAVVLTGAGRGFCAGIDMRDFGPDVPEPTAPALDRMRFQEKMAALAEAVRQLPQPVIAAVNGPCVGAGLALCLAAASGSVPRKRRSATPPSCSGCPAPRVWLSDPWYLGSGSIVRAVSATVAPAPQAERRSPYPALGCSR